MHPSLLILLIGLLYIFAFGALSFMRRQGLSTRFAVEGLVVTGIGAALSYASMPVNPILFLIVLYLVTMRVRLLVDLGNWFTSRKEYERALNIHRLALRLWPDLSSRQIVLINQGVTRLRMGEPDEACTLLRDALGDEKPRMGAKYLAAGYYNLGLACRRTGREAEAIRRFNEAIDALPNSIYAHAAQQALKRTTDDRRRTTDDR
ncbi:MAG TPA: tetratricopeptide repeat protein [Thermoflexia bacterium]|nr:tetratricopeptide repeat protein [Thermoflexia bacterium]